MTKQELIAKVVEELKVNEVDVNAKTADVLLKSIVNVVTNLVASGEKVAIAGLGTFEPKKRAARTGRNPSNGETINIPAKTVPGFKAATAFKTAVIEANK